ncbi:MAG: leucyl-tRNA synthetase [Acidimicrobiia bacterium]|nr:leucyl-tRNA synthetase [Acidimicrobiia bacterium]
MTEASSRNGADQPTHRYTAELAQRIETAWQARWDAEGTFDAPNPAGALSDGFEAVADRPHLFVMDMFPYPSGAGLHVGHPLGYIGTDVYARFKRMCGFNVLYTLGYDAFGLPAEQHAIATGVHPRVNTEQNVANMRRQLHRLGLSHDRRRSIATTDEDYYRWTQWIFLQIFNSWYDSESGRARPISELEAQFASAERATPNGMPWAEMSSVQRRELIDQHRLAYLSEAPVNWCPGLGTILANEEVTAEGRSDIGNYPVFKRNMRQWVMRITSYADRLLDDLDRLDWPEPIKIMQRNWIGRSEGARVRFPSPAGAIEVFTTRPDTLFGATFMVLAPEHPLVKELTSERQRDEVQAYVRQAVSRTEVQRQEEGRDKTGVYLGTQATNPTTGQPIPIWVADYVLMGYGTGAIMAVPSGDQRDFEFARRFGLPIVATQMPPDDWFERHGIAPTVHCDTWPEAYIGEGRYVNSANESVSLDGDRTVSEAKAIINQWLEQHGHGMGTVTYKLRDWLFSRQRYWGEPFPIVYDETGLPIALPESQLPVTLPDLEDFKPQALEPDDDRTDPIPPLARATQWVEAELDLGDGPRHYRREINVMPQWAGSCWYELRYIDPVDDQAVVDPVNERYWMGPRQPGDTGGVDLYVGGVEHAVLHLLYARFWHKVLYDLGHVSSEEPFHRLFNQGYIQAHAYRDERGQTVEASEVVERDGRYFHGDSEVKREYGKMGKSLKNVVTPDEMYDSYGADTFRLYEMSMGPLDASRPWNTRDVVGMQRFLQRVWRLLIDEETGVTRVEDREVDAETLRVLHRTIDGVRADMDGLRFNTSIAKLIELTNHLMRSGSAPREVADPLVLMLAPLAPHLAEELWSRLGHETTLAHQLFPEADPAYLVDEQMEIGVSVNGKPRARVLVPAGADEAAHESAARADDRIATLLDGRPMRKVVVVPGRLVNFVVG